MTLWFKNSKGIERQIASCDTQREVYRSINDFIEQANAAKPNEENHFKSYYVRTWEEDGRTWYDVGSWSELFFTTKE